MVRQNEITTMGLGVTFRASLPLQAINLERAGILEGRKGASEISHLPSRQPNSAITH